MLLLFFLRLRHILQGKSAAFSTFPGITENALWGMAVMSSAGVVVGGKLFSDPKKRRICIALSLALSGLAAHYGTKKAVSFENGVSICCH